ncbi:helix-turn-helix transcriptional regulator [Desulfofundulus salinus]|uniref:PadR family transcriptional regulator n=1 Tax=Desulfofundulus salinus TaxID=2419843 RepID=A0A494WW48_9FIRM|nr:helix-turn-helix transcriptional regulator [Desulfofundulus salinum]RKO67748.1 PadR family transcriptional regulator [Desulfofundulus salinum]
MCRNHGPGHRHGDCRCAGAPMERFMQPCLLLLLHRRSTHGYELIQSLREFGFHDSEADPGTVYRNLRRLEEEGLVSSQWDTSGGGPARRLYRLTPEGEELLHAWAEAITHNKRRLEYFLARYREEFAQSKY